MEALILDNDFDTLALIDGFDSFIWVDRYFEYGDFELVMSLALTPLEAFKPDNYLIHRNSNRMMIIETIEFNTDPEFGTKLTATGRSLESLLERRIVWGNKTLTGNFQNGIKTLLNENAINPSNVKRKIPKLRFKESTDPRITALTIDVQLCGDNLYDVIFTLCIEQGVGFRILPTEDGFFDFELYMGVDRSYNQEDRPYVVFSPEFENLLSSNYLESQVALKTAALIGGEGEGVAQYMAEVHGEAEELQRREIFVNASISSNNGEIPPQVYSEQLRQIGREELAKTQMTVSFEGEISAQQQFIYGIDFTIGDIVQVVNEYGFESHARVSELIQSHNAEGESLYPTFITV